MKKTLAFLPTLIFCAGSALAADGIWTNTAGGTWSTTTDWAGGTVADGAGFTADFSTIDITANRTVNLDSDRTIGRFIFGDASWTNAANYGYTISGTGTLTLDNTGGTGGNPPTITSLIGNAIFTSVVAGTSGLNISNPWSNYDTTRGTTSAQGNGGATQTTGLAYFDVANSLSGNITVNGGGLLFRSSGKFGNATALTITGNGSVRNGDLVSANNNGVTNRFGDGTATLSLGGATGAGTFTSAFAADSNTTSQTFAGLTVNAGRNILNTVNTAAGTNDLIFTGTGGAGYVRNTNGLLNVVSATGFNPQFTNAPTAAGGSSVSGTGSDAILRGAILNGSDFIAAASGNLAAATYDTTLTAGKNVNVTGALATSGNLSINSLRFGENAARTVTLGASDTLTLASGGILTGAAVATSGNTITGGSITSGQNDLWIYANGSGLSNPRVSNNALTIASKITGGISVTVGGGQQVVFSNAANDYTGGTFLVGGILSVGADGALGSTSGAVTAVSGVNYLAPSASFTFDASRNFVVNSGAVLFIGDRGATTTIAGQLSGGGQFGPGFVSNGQRVILTGNNSNFTGQYMVNGHLRATEGTSLSSNANLLFTGRAGYAFGNLETSGTFTRSLGSGAGQVQWQNDGQYGSGGFAAVGGELIVNLGGNATPDTLTWGSGYFVRGSSQELNLGSGVATDDLTFQNSIALNGAQRNIRVNAAGTTKAIISGTLSGNASSGINKMNPGTLVLTGNNTYQGLTTITGGTLSVSSLNSVSGGTASSSLGAPTTEANGTIGIGTTTAAAGLLYTGTGETTDRVINLAGTTGGATLDQSGTGNLKFTSALTASGSGAKTLTLQGSTAGTGEIAGAIVDNSPTNQTRVTKSGTGTWTLSGNNSYTGATTISLGQLSLSGSGKLNNSTIFVTGSNSTGTASLTFQNSSVLSGTDNLIAVGNGANERGVLNIKDTSSITLNGSVTGQNSLLVGAGGATGAGAALQSGGDVSVSNQLMIGTVGSGYYNMSGGNIALTGATDNTSRFRVGSPAAGSLGVFQQSGGAISFNTALGLGIVDSPTPGAAAGYGTYYMTGGTLTGNLTGQTGAISVGNRNGQGDFTLAGGTVNIGVNTVTLGGADATATGILNINGGSLQANNIASGTGTGYLSFAGGTLVANGNSATFLQGLTRATIQGSYTSGNITYAGGATINTNGQNVTVAQALLAPAGNGVAVGTFTPITGLIGAPYVQVLGTGTGATAKAIFDSSTGTMTGIVVTNPGVDYTGTPTFLISGGGLSANQTVNASTFINTSGGLTKTGAGTLTLSGTNTYSGATAVEAGTLSLGNGTMNTSLADTAAVVIGTDPTAILNLNYTGTDTIASLTINGVAKPAGVYGSSDPSGRITGTGTLTVGGASPYTTWANSFLPGNDVSNPAGDNDNDGLTNQQEFAFGLSPISGSSVNPIVAQLNKTTGQFSYQRLAGSGLTYRILTSTTLATGSWTQDLTATQVAGPTDGNGNQTVVVTLTGAPLTAPALFVRVAAD